MDLKQNPFSLYDFLGYLTPGAIAIYSGALIYAHAQGELSISNAMQKLSVPEANLYVPFILFAYLLGHLLSFLSSVTVERYAVWLWGYPSRFLLWRLRPIYETSDNWRNIIQRFFWSPKMYWKTNSRLEWIPRGLVGVVLFPIPILDNIIGRVLYLRNYASRELDAELSNLIKRKIVKLLKREGEVARPNIDKPHEFFRFIYHFALERAPGHVPKMQNYVALYGFLRTICLIFAIASWLLLLHPIWRPTTNGEVGSWIPWLLLLGFGLLSYISYMGFMKFYRRFSLEALMAMSAVYGTTLQPISKSHRTAK